MVNGLRSDEIARTTTATTTTMMTMSSNRGSEEGTVKDTRRYVCVDLDRAVLRASGQVLSAIEHVGMTQ